MQHELEIMIWRSTGGFKILDTRSLHTHSHARTHKQKDTHTHTHTHTHKHTKRKTHAHTHTHTSKPHARISALEPTLSIAG